MAPTLTICIPTYNRAALLGYLLHDLTAQAERLDPSFFAIIVSDNASTDETAEVVGRYSGKIPLRYHRRKRNFGAYNNVLFVYGKAESEFVVYCADDDLIDLGKLRELVGEMDGLPRVGAVYCPWALQNGADGPKQLAHFNTIETTLFERNGFKAALETILDNHLFPEIAIFRASATKLFPLHSTVAFWFFTVFPALLTEWDVVIKDKASVFYTFFLAHPAGRRSGSQVGNEEVATAWDTYRGGLEVFARTVQARDGLDLTATMHKINSFVMQRQLIAMRRQLRMGNYIDAYWLGRRLSLYHSSEVDPGMAEGMRIGAAIEHCFNQHFGDQDRRQAILVGRFPGPFVEIVKRWGASWFLNENYAPARTPRIDWNAEDPTLRADATASGHLMAYRL